MKKIYQWMLAGAFAVLAAVTPVDTAAAKTTAVEQTADGEQTVTYYTVSFDANKGKKVKKTLSLCYKDTYGKLPKTTRDGYEFQGWYTKKTGGVKVTSKTVFQKKADRVLYAHWKKAVTEETVNSGTAAPVDTSSVEEQKAAEVSQSEQQKAAEVSQSESQETAEVSQAETSKTPEASQASDAQSEITDMQMNFPVAGRALVNYSPNTSTDYKQNNYSAFLVLKNFKAKYLYCQFDYKRFISNGKNVGCTATADAMLASIYMDKPFSPNDEGWVSGVGAAWTNSVLVDNSKTFSVKRQCQAVYDYLNEGKPTLIRVTGHSVTAIGLRKGVDRATITPADILIADPADAKVKCADEMGYRVMQDATSFGLRIPKTSLPAK